MLHDATRNRAYALAIEDAIRASRGSGPVLDIGTGTGLLALMAARCRHPLAVHSAAAGSAVLLNPRCADAFVFLACTPALCAATTGLLPRPPSRREFSRVRRLAPWRSSPGAWWLLRAAQQCGTSLSWPSGRTSSAVRPSACGHSLRCTLCWAAGTLRAGSPALHPELHRPLACMQACTWAAAGPPWWSQRSLTRSCSGKGCYPPCAMPRPTCSSRSALLFHVCTDTAVFAWRCGILDARAAAAQRWRASARRALPPRSAQRRPMGIHKSGRVHTSCEQNCCNCCLCMFIQRHRR